MYNRYNNTTGSPARQAFPITPSDTAAIEPLPKGILVSTDGILVFRAVDSDTDITLTVSAGSILPIRVQYVRATGTTAQVIGLC